MPEVVGVRFKQAGVIYYFDPAGIDFDVNDWLVVETERGLAMGRVVIAPKQVLASELKKPLNPVIRKAKPEEIERAEEFKAKEKEILAKSAELVEKNDLPMRLIAAEYNFDGTHLTIYFTAEKRVDFRSLLKELRGTFKTRVELRQIGARDVAKLLGGVGICGRPLCCITHLTEFDSISVKMLRDQNLSLDISKNSGLCGKLLCCLKYEHEQYLAAQTKLPSIGEEVNTPEGKAKVVKVNPLKETVTTQLESEIILEFQASQIKALT